MKFWLQLWKQDWGRRIVLEERSHLLNKSKEKPISSYKTRHRESSQRSCLTSRSGGGGGGGRWGDGEENGHNVDRKRYFCLGIEKSAFYKSPLGILSWWQ